MRKSPPILTYTAYQDCLAEAEARMRLNNGHEYVQILKTRCIHCGRSPRVKTKCGGWFKTFVNKLGIVMQEKGFIAKVKEPLWAKGVCYISAAQEFYITKPLD